MVSLLINCQAENCGTIPTANGYLLLSALSQSMTEKSGLNMFHDSANRRKDFTISPLLSASRWKGHLTYPPTDELKIVKGDKYAFRICFLDDEKARVFRNYVLGSRFRLCNINFTACDEAGNLLFSRQDNEGSLLALPPADGTKLSFFTPTGIKSSKFGASLLLPRPEEIFSNMAQRWKEHFGDVPCEDIDYSAVAVLEFSLNSCYVRLKDNSPLRGCTGYARYSWKRLPKDQCSALTSLTLFAFYAGVGYKTAQGLGQVIPKLHYRQDRV